MLNAHIHETLEHKNLRDILGGMISTYNGLPVEFIQKQIEKLQADLEAAKKYEAAQIMMRQMDWKEHDVSDETEHWCDSKMSFIGTEEEYNVLIQTIEANKAC